MVTPSIYQPEFFSQVLCPASTTICRSVLRLTLLHVLRLWRPTSVISDHGNAGLSFNEVQLGQIGLSFWLVQVSERWIHEKLQNPNLSAESDASNPSNLRREEHLYLIFVQNQP